MDTSSRRTSFEKHGSARSKSSRTKSLRLSVKLAAGAVMAAVLALSATTTSTEAAISCGPVPTMNRRACNRRINACEAEGFQLKWTGIGCRS